MYGIPCCYWQDCPIPQEGRTEGLNCMKTSNRRSKGQHLHQKQKALKRRPAPSRPSRICSYRGNALFFLSWWVHSDGRTVAYASIAVETSSALAGELGSLFGAADSVGVAAVPPSETRVFLRLPSLVEDCIFGDQRVTDFISVAFIYTGHPSIHPCIIQPSIFCLF